MNILTDRLPEAIKINDRVYSVNTDFRDCLRIILAFEDGELAWIEKQFILVNNLYTTMPAVEDVDEALRKGLKFLNGGKDDAGDGPTSNLRLYSFSKDAEFIFSAFQQTHGIDLQNIEYLHWWKFMALFMDLGAETAFNNLIGLRKRIKTGKATKEERGVAYELGDILDVPEIDSRTIIEKEQEREFLERVQEARQRRQEAREQKKEQ